MLAMAVAGRELAAELEPHHMALYRNIICLMFLVPVVAWTGWICVRTPAMLPSSMGSSS